MSLILNKSLISFGELQNEGIDVIARGNHIPQNIRPLRILIVNLMPNKGETEKQFLRVLGNSPYNIDVEFIYTKTHRPKHISLDYLEEGYKTLHQVAHEKYDGMIITGAPVEQLDFEEVDYWEELRDIMDFSKTNIKSTLHICWGAQAGLYHHYGIGKHPVRSKVFGVFSHRVMNKTVKLLKGFDDVFLAPHSRYTEVRHRDFEGVEGLEILSESPDAGIYIAASRDGSQVFVTGHSEYDVHTLRGEYERDIKKGIDIQVPKNYFLNDDPGREPVVRWRAHANLLFSNWINHYVKINEELI